MADESAIDASSLEHGVFQFTFPHGWKAITVWVIGIILLGGSLLIYLLSLGVPDIVPLSEATWVGHPDQVGPEDEKPLGDGFEEGETGSYIIVAGVIERGVVARGHCSQDDDGNWHDNTNAEDEGAVRINPSSGGHTFEANWIQTLDPEINSASRYCPRDNWEVSEGSMIQLFILKQGDELWILSVGEGANEPAEKTGREDMQRVSLAIIIFSSLMLMFATPTSLAVDIRRLRGKWENRPYLHGKPGELAIANGPTRQADKLDWVLPPPSHESWPANPYAADEGQELIPEHPINIGTPTPATFTLYSINGMIFITSSIWLASDLLARHNSYFSALLGSGLRFIIVGINLTWIYFSFKEWKLLHNVIDTPTSKVRSVAVGSAELVGQIRPGPEGTLGFEVAGDPQRRVEGAVAYHWKEEEHVCTGSGKNRSCSWRLRSSDEGNIPFILHDGTGGILIEPSSWKKIEHGSELKSWGGGKWRWTTWVLGVGDPIYCLGRVETRTEDEKEEGLDGSIPNSHLIVRGNKDIGMQVHLHRGTELTLLAKLRSTTEAVIVPLVMLTFSAIPFLW
ncbi:MAG TPA: hypothetical protein EYQ73_06550 [Candidatus Poseidoniales archaeon]|jgi:hypothetical protein|nr:MAG: hypothetical protein CXT71_00250 [Euryarchaeota archaeon]HIF46431.1 hypothetical protein [Candidatus Poseidoniales archaeon]